VSVQSAGPPASAADGTALPSRRLQSGRLATAMMFSFNGLLFGAWVPHIPSVKADLGLSDAALGFALLAPGFGALISMTLVGRATIRWGSGRTTTAMAFISYVGITLPGLAFNLPTLFLALAAWGFGTGGLDVAMNAQALQLQGRYGRPIISSFHAFWSVGTLIGTLIGSLGAGAHLNLAAQQATLGALFALVTVWAARQFVADQPTKEPAEGTRVITFRLILLGIAGVCALLAEGSASDWSPVYLRDDLHVAAGHTGIAFGALTVMMTIGRTVGDRVVQRVGRNLSLALLSAIGAVGLSIGLLTETVAGAAIGFGCLGLGLSVMVPIFFAAAGDGPGPTGPKLAVVTSLSYLGFLLGPAALGPLASATSVHSALWILPVFLALAGVLGVTASRMRLSPH
jgi:MFS family permease